MDVNDRIGFMQGRLSPLVDGKIQAFPWSCWEAEFPLAQSLGIRLMEWTLDHERLEENPLMTGPGRERIKELCAACGVAIPSLTGDLFMQAPLYKAQGRAREALVEEMRKVVRACGDLGIAFVVMPLVDNGRLEDHGQEDALVGELERLVPLLSDCAVRVVFESDYAPSGLERFIGRLDPAHFGVNLDTGNSAAMGLDWEEELSRYGHRILNVHIKDRLFKGTTVPLGQGAAALPETVVALEKAGYAGNYILQTARAQDGDHAGVLAGFRDMLAGWMDCGAGE